MQGYHTVALSQTSWLYLQENQFAIKSGAVTTKRIQCSAEPVVFLLCKVREMAEECVVFTQLWFYGGNALCVWVLPPCVVPFTLTLNRNKCL